MSNKIILFTMCMILLILSTGVVFADNSTTEENATNQSLDDNVTEIAENVNVPSEEFLIENHGKNKIDAHVEISNPGDDISDMDVKINNHVVKSIKFNKVTKNPAKKNLIRLDDVPETGELSKYVEVYAIDPTELDFESAEVTIIAKGNFLYKCKDWDFETQTCPAPVRNCTGTTKDDTVCTVYGGWKKVQVLIPGEEYTFTLTPEDPGYAEYSATYGAPFCSNGESPCIANSTLLMSVDSVATPEPNQPNTVDACTDGASGTYMTDENVENITITDLNSSTFTVGDTIMVSAYVYCYDGTADNVNFVYSNTSISPSWSVMGYTDPCPAAGWNNLSATFTLDDVIGNHTARVIIQYNGATTTTCGAGAYDDNDDVVFNVSQRIFEGGNNTFMVFWDGTSGNIPSGWSCVSCSALDPFYQRFIVGSSVYGATGGSLIHTHTATWVSSTSSTSAGGSGAGTTSAAGVHAHNTLGSQTVTSASNMPSYRSLIVIKYNSGTPTTIPAGAIVMFNNTLPSGWTQYSAQDNYFIIGNGTSNVTGGSNTHTHPVSITTGVPSATSGGGFGSTLPSSTHTHAGSGTSNATDQRPPYRNVILAKANSNTAVPDGMIAVLDTTPISTWEVVSGSGKAFYDRFIVGSASYGGTGGLSSHTHVNLLITTGTYTGGVNDATNGGGTRSNIAHTHNIVVSFDTKDNLPPYTDAIFGYVLIPPEYYDNITSYNGVNTLSGIYAPNNNIGFEINCTDNTANYNALFEQSGTNYSMSNTTPLAASNIFTYNLTDQSAGTINYKLYCNDTAGLTNGTDSLSVVISKNTTIVQIYNSSPSNTTYTISDIWFNLTTDQEGPNSDRIDTSLCWFNLNDGSNYSLDNTTGNWNNLTTGLPDGTYNVSYYCNNTDQNYTVNTNYTSVIFNTILDTGSPQVEIVYPLGHNIDVQTDVAIVLDIIEPNLDTIYANITSPNTTLYQVTNFTTSLESDNFNTDTEGINWVLRNVSTAGQTCSGDIDGTVADKMFISADANSIAYYLQCGFNSIKKADGDFDVNVSFNVTEFNDDTFFTFRANSKDALTGEGLRAYINIIKKSGAIEYRFGYNNGTATYSETISTTDTYGKFRIKRYNFSTGSPVFNLYYWNNTGNVWMSSTLGDSGNITISDSPRMQYIQMKPGAEGSTFGRINVTIDDFNLEGETVTYGIFNANQFGRHNVTIFVNDTYGYINNTEETYFNVTSSNIGPSKPFIITPSGGVVISGIYNITWNSVTDPEGDNLRFNITLLNPDKSVNSSIITDYGNATSTFYALWDTTSHPDGLYNIRVIVYENETLEQKYDFDDVDENFTIDNTLPEYLNNQSQLITTYSPSAYLNFSIDWSDPNFANAYLENNFTGPLENTSMSGTYPNFYYNTTPLATGTYAYRFVGNDSAENSNATDTFYFTIAKADNPVSLYLNGTLNNNRTYIYPEAVNATGVTTSGTVNLYRDGSLVTGCSGAVCTEEILLPNNTHEYHVNSTGNANYSDNTSVTYYALVNKGPTETYLYINGSRSNRQMNQYQLENFTVYTNVSGMNVELWTNYSDGVYKLWDSSGEPLYNWTNLTSIGNFSFSGNFSGNENYTDSYETWYVNVEPLVYYLLIEFTDPTPQNATMRNYNWMTVNTTINSISSVDTCTLEWNGSNETMNKIVASEIICWTNKTGLSDGNYTYIVYANDTTIISNVTDLREVQINNPPSVIIDSPLNATIDQNCCGPIAINVSDPNGVNTSIAEVTLPDGFKQNITLYPMRDHEPFSPSLLGTIWMVENDSVEPGQTCIADIDSTSPGKAYTSISGDGSPSTGALCSLIMQYPIYGDFDINITFNVTGEIGTDTALNFQLTEKPTSLSGKTIFMSIGNWTGYDQTYDIFADDENVSGYIGSRETDDTEGKFRIKRIGNNFTFYTWNNTVSSWTEENVTQNEFIFSKAVYITLEVENGYSQWGSLAVEWDDLYVSHQDYIANSFRNTTQLGVYNVTVMSNDTYDAVNDTEKGNFTVIFVNNHPSIPYILTPYQNIFVNNGVYNVTWSDVYDQEDDMFIYNITLLNQDYSYNDTIVTSYGNNATNTYLWNTTKHPDGNYSMQITVFENETAEENSNYYDMRGHFTIDNTYPLINYELPTESTGSFINRNYIMVNTTASDNYFYATEIYLYDSNQSEINSSYTEATDNFINFTSLPDGLYYFDALAADYVLNLNWTERRNVTIDTSAPKIDFTAPTELDNITKSRTWIIANISLNEQNLENYTYYLYNSTDLINSTTFTTYPNMVNWTDLSNGVYYYNITVHDLATNYNMSETRSITLFIDNTLPTYTNNQSQLITTYSPSAYSNFSIDWNDNSGSVNAYLENNFTGPLENISMSGTYPNFYYSSLPLTAGTYAYRFVGNDSAENSNATDTLYFTISQADSPVELYLDGTLNDNETYTYPEMVGATGNSYGGPVEMYRDTTQITCSGITCTDSALLGHGTYTYKVNSTGDANYSANFSGVTFYAIVNKGTSICELSLGSTEITYSLTPTTNATCTCESDSPALLYRDNSDISLTENNTFMSLAAGIYNYTCNVSGSNYTSDSISQLYTVNKALLDVKLYLNGTNGPKSYIINSTANITATVSPADFIVNITSNWGIYKPEPSDTDRVENLTNMTDLGTLNFTAYSIGNENYTSGSETWFVTVTLDDTTPPVISNGWPAGTLATRPGVITVQTNELATCKYSTTAGTSYANMTGVTALATSHSWGIATAGDGRYTYYVRCRDSLGNMNTDDYVITFILSTALPPSGGVPSGAPEIGGGETESVIETIIEHAGIVVNEISFVRGEKTSFTLIADNTGTVTLHNVYIVLNNIPYKVSESPTGYMIANITNMYVESIEPPLIEELAPNESIVYTINLITDKKIDPKTYYVNVTIVSDETSDELVIPFVVLHEEIGCCLAGICYSYIVCWYWWVIVGTLLIGAIFYSRVTSNPYRAKRHIVHHIKSKIRNRKLQSSGRKLRTGHKFGSGHHRRIAKEKIRHVRHKLKRQPKEKHYTVKKVKVRVE